MNFFRNTANEILSLKSDPNTDYLVVKSGWILVIMLVLYGLVVMYAYYYMKNREHVQMKNFISHYNAIILISNFSITCSFIYYQLYGKFDIMCQEVSNKDKEISRHLGLWFHIYFLSKSLELTDSVILILRKKFAKQSFLHYYHHISMFILAWVGLKFLPGGSSVILATINSACHFLIYLYYHLTSYEWSRIDLSSFGILSTVCQLVQFSMAILHCLTAWFLNCGYPRSVLLFMILYILSFIVMFFGRHCTDLGSHFWRNHPGDNPNTQPGASSEVAPSSTMTNPPRNRKEPTPSLPSTFLPPPAVLPSHAVVGPGRLNNLNLTTLKNDTLTNPKRKRNKSVVGSLTKEGDIGNADDSLPVDDLYIEDLEREMANFANFLAAPRFTIEDPLERLIYEGLNMARRNKKRNVK